MDQDNLWCPITPPDLHEFIGQARTQRRITHDLLQFRIQALVASRPVNICIGYGEKERHEVREIRVKNLFPGAVVVCHAHSSWDRAPASCGEGWLHPADALSENNSVEGSGWSRQALTDIVEPTSTTRRALREQRILHLVLRTTIAAPVWRGGSCCNSVRCVA